uniref:Uncharacterized protein n=1 Tax=Ananas comosus var. bracteatus TaxID=296719 RepID=A0A6V7NRS3_ANACO|nr:unnamed protein product [Ananas comosus var. bracteatus]
MEKPATRPKSIVNIFHFLSKPTSLVYIPPHPPYSPRGENTCPNKGFAVSLVPRAARVRKGKSSSGAEEEPTSPKVSCTGQIKRKKKKKKKNQQQQQQQQLPCRTSTLHADRRENNRIFTENTKSSAMAPPTMMVAVGEMRRFASGRKGGAVAAAALREFDWEKVEREMKLDAENGGVVKEARKEVNLWKRRAMASRPIPLET